MSGLEELDRSLDPDNQEDRPFRPPQAEDPGDFNQRRRLREIADHERMARETLIRADASGAADDAALAFATVKTFAQQLQWPVARHGEAKYYNRKLGSISIEPPDELKQLADPRQHGKVRTEYGTVVKVWGDAETQPKTYDVVGLFPVPEEVDAEHPGGTPFTRLPTFVSAEWSVLVDLRNKEPRSIPFAAQTPVPPSITNQAYELCGKFLSEAGLDVRSEGERDESSAPV